MKSRDQLIEEHERKMEEMRRELGVDRFPVETDIRRIDKPPHADPFAAAANSGAALEILRDLKSKIETITLKMVELERKFEERVPSKTLSEEAFQKEIVDSGNLAQEIIDGVKEEVRVVANARPIVASRDQMTIVEQKRIEKVLSVLQEHGRLSSPQLATIMNLSRTRCNEYFRQMETMGLVEGVEVGKEKFYKPCN